MTFFKQAIKKKRFIDRILLILLFLMFSAVSVAYSLTQDEETNIRVYRDVSPSVVNITTTTITRELFSIFPRKGAGSGSIIDPKGYILTNNHVVEGASKVTVTLSDGSKYPAAFVGADPENDIAIIKIEADKPLTPLSLGNSDKLQVGQKVFAIGNPFGLNSTLTTGIVSALGRPLTTEGGMVIENVIQTDAPINPGNSGGPLIDTSGEMIGINTAIFAPGGGNIGIGFAIPVNIAKDLIPDLITYGSVRRPWLGITGVPIWRNIAEALKLPVTSGILISRVENKGPAAKAGIKGGVKPVEISGTIIYLGGDIILEIDDVNVSSTEDIKKALRGKKEGQKVDVKVLRGDRIITLSVTVELKS